MDHKPYKLSDQEVETLISAVITKPKEDVYIRMMMKASDTLKRKLDIDEDFLDMSEAILKTARKIEVNDEESIVVQNAYYMLHSILRKISHELHMIKIKSGESEDNARFVRLVHHNKNSPPVY